MELLLAALLLLVGTAPGTAAAAVPIEQLLQAAADSGKAAAPAPSGTADISIPETEFVKSDPQTDAPAVKGVYVTAHSAAGSRLNALLKLLDETELNSFVIDVKDDYGHITYDTENPELNALGTTKPIIADMPGLMATLQEHDVYPIARVVVFKDTVLAGKKPELSFLNPDGTLWTNGKSTPDSFVNPYEKQVWDYNVAVAKEAAKSGFKEIQFDYVRFPEGFEKRAEQLSYTKDDRPRIDAVADFVKYAREQLAPLGVRVSVDIFGYAASVPAAEGIGQDFGKIAKYVDVIAPMVYPSHYGTGWFGSKVPDAAPYATIHGAMADTTKKLDPLGSHKPVVRPWLQDFTASWVQGHIEYGKREIEEQIRALKDSGIDEFLLWNAGNTYTKGVSYE
ncbi:GTP-binding protein [Paenibacillus hemerocallicola]|uniref:GTP-binding protein n=1 Tax=Paenibacillus hemerocallicola TaxID=1172614 RepID=A0A5C4T9R3_9BACL|nr:putative glycoside hydrolase [Paenibacillus hemerocallicola]TNJ65731.1 GTP-binding protein [Paenibacillus hemerocallicola]